MGSIYVVSFQGVPCEAFADLESLETYFQKEGTTLKAVQEDMEFNATPDYEYHLVDVSRTRKEAEVASISEGDFEHCFGRKPTAEEWDRFVHYISNGVSALLDWDIIYQCTKEAMR